MLDLTNLNTVKRLLSEHGIALTKARGQNFIINPSVCPRMAEMCGAGSDDGVLEIGPGIGVLTAELAKTAGKVVSVEVDAGLLPVLEETLVDFKNVEIVHADALKLDLGALIREKFGERRVFVCANLPYNISTPLLMLLLENNLPIESITVMVQKEFAERITAPVGSRKSGAVTVAAAYYAKAEKLFEVSAGSFFPAPKVDSAVMRLTPCAAPPIALADRNFFFRLVNAGFCQRRKTLQNSLSSGLGVSKSAVAKALDSLSLPHASRVEELSLPQLAALSKLLSEAQNG